MAAICLTRVRYTCLLIYLIGDFTSALRRGRNRLIAAPVEW
jgi:hypothetical protein